jgi:hypothetical protein
VFGAAVGGGAAVAAAAQPNFVQFGRTTNFIVSYDDALGADGQTISQAIIDTCEADFQTLQGYFGGITPAGLPFNVQVTTDDTGAGHFGCAGTELFIGARSAATLDTVLMRQLVIAEEDEVFEANFGQGWDCGASNGEGLSRVLGNDMVPGSERPNFVSAPVWLDNDRPDYLNATDPTDRNYLSIGCSVLFLNWMRFQLGFGWDKIIAAGDTTLAGTYANLTGANDGPDKFMQLMEANFPSDQPSGLATDNPFPLPD